MLNGKKIFAAKWWLKNVVAQFNAMLSVRPSTVYPFLIYIKTSGEVEESEKNAIHKDV